MHALELVAASELDFRDVGLVASLCSSTREAVRVGPLSLVTEDSRFIYGAHTRELLHMLQWCGAAVHVLRLDQAPKCAWNLPPRHSSEYDQALRRKQRLGARERVEIVERIAELCPNLQVLGVSGFGWGRDVFEDDRGERLAAALLRLPKLHAVHVANQSVGLAESVSYLPVLAACPQLIQLDVCLNAALAAPVLRSPHAARLRQICVTRATASVLRLLARCTALSRLHVEGCEPRAEGLESFPLADFLPPALTTLDVMGVMDEGRYSLIDASFCETLARRISRIERVHIGNDECGELSAGALSALCTLPCLRVLEIDNAYALTDNHLADLAAHCPNLHTLCIAYADGVTSNGFGVLVSEPSRLPQLRALKYHNGVFECDVDDLLCAATEAELNMEEQVCLHDDDAFEEYVRNCAVSTRSEYEHCVRAFFAYARLVRVRALAVVRDGSGGHLLPSQQHRLAVDYLCLGVDS